MAACEREVIEALKSRVAAHKMDPDHTDPSWQIDAQNINGKVRRHPTLSVDQMARDAHDRTVAHYREWLRPVYLSAKMPKLTKKAAKAAIVVPKGVKLEDTMAYKALQRRGRL